MNKKFGNLYQEYLNGKTQRRDFMKNNPLAWWNSGSIRISSIVRSELFAGS